MGRWDEIRNGGVVRIMSITSLVIKIQTPYRIVLILFSLFIIYKERKRLIKIIENKNNY